ncbi:MAG: hypothetical protein RR728_06380, partial [Oscillospiraceae bacterium]
GLVDTEYLLSKMTKVQFIKLVTSEGQDEGLDIESPKRMNDEQVRKIVYKISKCQSPQEFCQLPQMKREILIKKIKDEGVSFRQLSKHTGVGIGVIRRCCDDKSLIPVVFDRLLKRNKNTSVAWLTNGVKKPK